MPANQITIPQQGTANYAPGTDGTPGPYQPGSTLVPNPGKADGTGLGTGSNTQIISGVPDPAYVPNPAKADGIGLGTGTGVTFLASSTQVPSPQKADGTGVGTGSNVGFVPSSSNQRITYVPNPTQADGTDGGSGSTGPAPSPPTSADIQDGSSNSNTIVTWTNGATLGTTNQVFRSTDGTNYSLRATVAGSATQFTDTGTLANGNMWFYKVCAVFNGASSAFSNIVSVCQNFTCSDASSISFPTLINSYGSFTAQNLASVTSVSLPLMRNCSGALVIKQMPALVSASIPVLVQPLSIDMSSNSLMTSLTMTALSITNQGITFAGSQCGLSFPNLTTQGINNNGDFDVSGNTHATTIDMPGLVVIAGGFIASGMTALTTVNLPALSEVGAESLDAGGRLDFTGCTSLISLNLLSLGSIFVELDFSGCTSLTSVSCPNLFSIDGGGVPTNIINGSGCTNLVTVDFSQLQVIGDGLIITFQNDKLNAASINGILAAGVISGLVHTTFNLQGGTNAAPTGQGVTDKATLIANGNTVNTN